MTTEQVPVDDADVIARILSDTDVLLLDFDGPVCSVFAGLPAHHVASRLRDVLVHGGHADLPPEVDKTEDPFDVLHYAATLGEVESHHVEAALRAHEVEAALTAAPTEGAHDLIRTWSGRRGALGIVSNNSAACVQTYLHLHELDHFVALVSARTSSDPGLLKPASYLVDQAVRIADAQPRRCTLVGDSVSDIQAARSAGVMSVGYANKPAKLVLLSATCPDVVISTVEALQYV